MRRQKSKDRHRVLGDESETDGEKKELVEWARDEDEKLSEFLIQIQEESFHLTLLFFSVFPYN